MMMTMGVQRGLVWQSRALSMSAMRRVAARAAAPRQGQAGVLGRGPCEASGCCCWSCCSRSRPSATPTGAVLGGANPRFATCFPALRGFATFPLASRRTLATTVSSSNPIGVSDAAIERINAVNKRKGYDPPKALLVQVVAGKCSGFAYNIKFSNDWHDNDIVIEADGAKVVVDAPSVPFLQGSTLDFVSELGGKSFAIVGNPNAESGCGCGVSFNLKDDAEDFKADGF
ncbi:hypothetical protein PTSG_11814 [Salpingoeca rosetta]|uniref:Core domain-containing protein n=1 Tax=Salpingoeca rosetta (strain ATCC 50818 / BSB-021) TaxID=946362 RepID=F2TZH2_SALR5|nr:uncharacterized protein PTSG_11814 [Salpingoeca rosetta]EGD78996.1 hypothetical protein PTSG_11814 [Salpingoeca rosetta]|eukprot:XP_004997952.1 hypothetical protein PTSG_11814 [Salpingoeca rosetta]